MRLLLFRIEAITFRQKINEKMLILYEFFVIKIKKGKSNKNFCFEKR